MLSGTTVAIPGQPIKWMPDPNTEMIRDYLSAANTNRARLVEWLGRQNYQFGSVTTYFESGGDFKDLRAKFVAEVLLPKP
jgi:hypothetical protein